MSATGLRRLAIAGAAVALSGVILRPQLSMTATLRGDEFAARGEAVRSRAMYERALVLDAENGAAVDRLLSAAILAHDHRLLAGEIARASSYLRRHAKDTVVLADRALAYHVSRQYRLATSDFTIVGRQTRDARCLTFAAFDVLQVGDARRATALLREAVRIDPGFRPARRALSRWT